MKERRQAQKNEEIPSLFFLNNLASDHTVLRDTLRREAVFQQVYARYEKQATTTPAVIFSTTTRLLWRPAGTYNSTGS